MNRWPYVRQARSIATKRGGPLYVIFFVTNRCHARCAHCFVDHDNAVQSLELTLDEYDRITRTLGPILFCFLTGGEASARDDIVDIARLLVTRNGVQKIQIPTAGAHTDRTVAMTEGLLSLSRDVHLGVSVSIDGIGDEHDRIRGVPGLFERAIRTYHALKAVERKRPNLSVNVGLTFSALNQHSAADTYRFLADELNVQNILYTVVRGKPRDPVSRDGLDLRALEQFNALVDNGILTEGRGYQGFPFASMVNAKNLFAHRLNIEQLQAPGYRIPCYAGRLAAVVDHRGKVYPCELLDRPLGDLREAAYDFQAIWRSAQAGGVRDFIEESRCFCTHECFLSTNILYNPTLVPKMLGHWSRIQRGSRRGASSGSDRAD